jgi:hypothetical protein
LYDPCTVTSDTNDARTHELVIVTRKIVIALDSLSQLVFEIDDPQERATVSLALEGRGKPVGVKSCEQSAGALIVRVDPAITPPSLVRHLVAIERRRFASAPSADVRGLDDAQLARLVARAIQEPDLDENRIIEHRVPELDTR